VSNSHRVPELADDFLLTRSAAHEQAITLAERIVDRDDQFTPPPTMTRGVVASLLMQLLVAVAHEQLTALAEHITVGFLDSPSPRPPEGAARHLASVLQIDQYGVAPAPLTGAVAKAKACGEAAARQPRSLRNESL
jgi:hypothetical protein